MINPCDMVCADAKPALSLYDKTSSTVTTVPTSSGWAADLEAELMDVSPLPVAPTPDMKHHFCVHHDGTKYHWGCMNDTTMDYDTTTARCVRLDVNTCVLPNGDSHLTTTRVYERQPMEPDHTPLGVMPNTPNDEATYRAMAAEAVHKQRADDKTEWDVLAEFPASQPDVPRVWMPFEEQDLDSVVSTGDPTFERVFADPTHAPVLTQPPHSDSVDDDAFRRAASIFIDADWGFADTESAIPSMPQLPEPSMTTDQFAALLADFESFRHKAVAHNKETMEKITHSIRQMINSHQTMEANPQTTSEQLQASRHTVLTAYLMAATRQEEITRHHDEMERVYRELLKLQSQMAKPMTSSFTLRPRP